MDTSLSSTPPDAAVPPVDDLAGRKAVAAGHETSDVNVKGLFVFGFAMAVVVAVVFVGIAVVFGAFAFFNRHLDARRPAREPGAASLVKIPPNYDGPLLQVKPEEDLAAMRTGNATELQNYAWIDRRAGVVRLPVDRAMDLLVARGLPPVSPGLTLEALQRVRAQPQVFGQGLHP